MEKDGFGLLGNGEWRTENIRNRRGIGIKKEQTKRRGICDHI